MIPRFGLLICRSEQAPENGDDDEICGQLHHADE